jgi:hypothetical protein
MRILTVVLLASGLPVLSCLSNGKVCTTLYAYGLSVQLTDASTGQPITGATLTLSDGDYQEVMIAFPGPAGNYAGAGERAGTYTLVVTAQGYQSKTVDSIVVTANECHVIGVHLDVQLQPVP